jgi:hypothetical protein
LRRLPTLSHDYVFHIGTLDPAQAHWHSYEGAGVSVSLCPAVWDRIAELPEASWWRLERAGARFLDRHALDGRTRQAIADWGVRRGLAESRHGVRIDFDYEYEFSGVERCVLYCATRAEALEEIEQEELDNAEISLASWLVALPALGARCGVSIGQAGDCFDYLLPVWVEDCTDFDGVWWEDDFDPEGLSAPRGVILPSRLDRFQRVELTQDERRELDSPY